MCLHLGGGGGIERIHKKKLTLNFQSANAPTLVYYVSSKSSVSVVGKIKKNKTFLAIELFYLCTFKIHEY